jgi:UDP-glucose 4-epimerase
VDVEDTARLVALLAGTDAVVHTASLHVPDLAARSREEFRAVNVDATRRLLQAAGAAGVGRFIYTSTTSLYGDAMLPAHGAAAWVDESLPPQPRDVYDETKLAAEEACREAALAGLACTSLRISRCFPEEPRLVAIYRLYRGVDADDVAQAHELALAAAGGGFEVYNVSAPPPFRRDDCRRLFEDAASVLLERLPWAEAEFASRDWELPRSIDRVYVVDKAIAELGYRPQHDFAALFRRPAS